MLSIANTKETYEEKKAVVELAGYTVANDTHNPVEKLPVTDVSVKLPTTIGNRTIQARWKKGKCDAFIVQGTMGPVTANSQWQQFCVSSRAKCEVTLEPGQWAIRVIGIYSTGEAEASNPVLFMIS